ncbi:hypothetical protein B0J13DRAFT_329556 [Dactylonectria estremocensis]|uniref:Clr5 domain-containing protein n=1 Tax=Dactylonectria estremocensis TaxID=1079267 RepID=A0A9P9EV62_9HYPO|nr:hypothetical protein B0J13DRAFT_329556 [Dactylonectria estremocensis]
MADTAASIARRPKGRQRHGRSSRITDLTWDFYKPLLCNLYQSYTLAVVMALMKQKFDFTPTKRQYGYRFEKWGIRKYNSAEKQGLARNLPELDKLINDPAISDFFNTLSPDLGISNYAPRPFLGVSDAAGGNVGNVANTFSDVSATTSPSTASDADASFFDGDTAVEDPPSPPRTPFSDISYPWGTDDEVKKLVADFCSAMSDDQNASDLYLDLFQVLSMSPSPLYNAKSLIVTSFARAAQNPRDAKRAQQTLSRYRDQIRTRGYDRPFLFSMLDANLQESDETLQSSATHRQVCDTIRKVLKDDDTELGDIPHNYSAIDLVTYHFLSSALEVYEKTIKTINGQLPVLSAEALLHTYVYRQPLADTIRIGGTSPLRICIDWCARQLKLKHTVPAEVASIQCADTQRQWCDNIHLFCTLWHSMLLQVQNGTPPAWYGPCESALGISPSELLVTVCWMIGSDADTDSANDILKRADTVLDTMTRLSEGRIWLKFLRTFTWMNKLVDTDDGDKAFEATVLQHCRRYIVATLNVDLPFPAEPVADTSGCRYLDEMESFSPSDGGFGSFFNVFDPMEV